MNSKPSFGSSGSGTSGNQNGGLLSRVWLKHKDTFAAAIAILIPLLLTTVHMMVFNYLWAKPQVAPNCTCGCWDTVFKGPYEGGPGRYKHVYFNVTRTSFKMWTLTVVGLLALYESMRKLIGLFLRSQLRTSMCILFLGSIQSNYFAWWVTWNYWNDGFNKQWNHQLYFTLTELLSTFMSFLFLDLKKPLKALPLLLIANIALFHVLTSSWDQFISNVILGNGTFFQIIRDLIIMFTDLLYLTVSLSELYIHSKVKSVTLQSIIFRKGNFLPMVALTSVMFVWFLILNIV